MSNVVPLACRRLIALASLSLAVVLLTARPAAAATPPAGLRTVTTAHYEIQTDIADKSFVDDLGKRMDVMYDQYAKQLAEFSPKADAPPLPVLLFAKRSTYAAFAGPAGLNTAGLFAAGKTPFLASFLEPQGRDELRRTLQHEAFHQFAYFTVSKHLPIWLNEGLAQVFEEGIWTGRDFLLGQIPPRRIRQLKLDVDQHRLLPFDRFLTITHKQWATTLHGSAEAGATYYGEAWAVAQFLSRGTNKAFTKRLNDLLHRLHDIDAGTSGDRPPEELDTAAAEAFKAVFPKTRDFQQAFDRWAVAMHASDEATLLERQGTLADFLASYRDKGQAFDTVDAFRRRAVDDGVRMRYWHGAVEYATDPNVNVYFADLQGRLYAADALYFDQPSGRPPPKSLPDLVCWPARAFHVRTHFYPGDKGKLEHEVSIELVDAPRPVAPRKPPSH